MRASRPRVLLTGAAGFLGRHIERELREAWHVIGVDLSTEADRWQTISRPEDLAMVARKIQPDAVVHAAFVNHRSSDQSRRAYLREVRDVNLRLFETLAECNCSTILLSSSSVYGPTEERGTADETCELTPVSLYGMAKLLQERIARRFAASGLPLCVVRPFNCCGPGQRRGMLIPDWLCMAKAVALGNASSMTVRHLQAHRDFIDARDVARAVSMMLTDFVDGGVFNVCSGHTVNLQEIVAEIQRLCPVPLQVATADPIRPRADMARQCGSYAKTRDTFGWRPTIPFRQSLEDAWAEIWP